MISTSSLNVNHSLAVALNIVLVDASMWLAGCVGPDSEESLVSCGKASNLPLSKNAFCVS